MVSPKLKIAILLLAIISLIVISVLFWCNNKSKYADNIGKVGKLPIPIEKAERVIGVMIEDYHGELLYKKFKEYNDNIYKDIENKCLNKNTIKELFQKYILLLKEDGELHILIYRTKDKEETQKLYNKSKPIREYMGCIIGVLIDKYEKCENNKDTIISEWNNLIQNSNDSELWIIFLSFVFHWNDDFITDILRERIDKKINNRTWVGYLESFASHGTLETG